MSGTDGIGSDDHYVSIQAMPRTALQAIYHAVTGKTERLSRNLRGNVIIRHSDFEQLYRKIIQQMEHYNVFASPTVTIIVKEVHSESLQYSSWERFSEFQVNSSMITSEVSIKIEFITQMPNTLNPQRFVINVGLDSGLPIIHNGSDRESESPLLTFFGFLARDFPTVEISIDFVDFLIAKIFAGVVEDWFNSLQKIENPRLSLFLLTRIDIVTASISQTARFGFAIFLASYVFFTHGIGAPGHFAYGMAVGIVIWSLLAVLSTYINRIIAQKIFGSICPSVILFTDGDNRAYINVKEKSKSSSLIIITAIFSAIVTIILNIFSSYLCTLL